MTLTGLCVVIYFPLSRVRFLFVRIEADDSFGTALSAGKLLGVGTHALSSGCLKSAQPLEDALDSGLTLKCGGSTAIPAANFDGCEACQWFFIITITVLVGDERGAVGAIFKRSTLSFILLVRFALIYLLL
jgi:hypothetical protein